jgi:hypothetical protein
MSSGSSFVFKALTVKTKCGVFYGQSLGVVLG